jgi:hypothetical protein
VAVYQGLGEDSDSVSLGSNPGSPATFFPNEINALDRGFLPLVGWPCHVHVGPLCGGFRPFCLTRGSSMQHETRHGMHFQRQLTRPYVHDTCKSKTYRYLGEFTGCWPCQEWPSHRSARPRWLEVPATGAGIIALAACGDRLHDRMQTPRGMVSAILRTRLVPRASGRRRR